MTIHGKFLDFSPKPEEVSHYSSGVRRILAESGLSWEATHKPVTSKKPPQHLQAYAPLIGKVRENKMHALYHKLALFGERYMGWQAFIKIHPQPIRTFIYHDGLHTLYTANLAFTLAKRRGLSHQDALFIQDVAFLHDIDPYRLSGFPTRVPKTLEVLKADFNREKSILGETNTSFLRDQLQWTEHQYHMAVALIQRTEYPFIDDHPSPIYRATSPVAMYEQYISQLPVRDRAFVLREGALLSEYADKGSWYGRLPFSQVVDVVKGLALEMTNAGGTKVDTKKLVKESYQFLSAIGRNDAFGYDYQLAQSFGISLQIPLIEEVFGRLLPEYGAIFEENLKSFLSLQQTERQLIAS